MHWTSRVRPSRGSNRLVNAQAAVDDLSMQLADVARPDRADDEKRYLKSDLDFLGVTLPDMRAIAKQFSRANSGLAHRDLVAIVERLWDEPVFERRMLAVLLLCEYADALSAADALLFERLIRESGTWALVDTLTTDAIGTLVSADPAAMAATLDRWVRDDDFWLRRASLLALLKPIRSGRLGTERLFEYADRLLDEKEFFIRKAIGWVLRDITRGGSNADAVYKFLAPRAHRASGVTMREAVKYLGSERSEALVTLYRTRKSVE
jgi:3-methyladenine DNA glycosylase AlkD